jgi:hypothetical protein
MKGDERVSGKGDSVATVLNAAQETLNHQYRLQLLMMFQTMRGLERVPFIMADTAVLIQVDRIKHALFRILEISFKFFPTHEVIPVGVHVSEMGVKRLWVRHFSAVKSFMA